MTASLLADIPLQKNDVLYIPSIHDLKEEATLTIHGEVANPGTYLYSDNMTVEDLVLQAGGLLESASTTKVEVARRVKNPKSSQFSQVVGESFAFDLKDGFLTGEGSENFHLQPFDVLMTEGGDPDKLGRGAIIQNPPKDCIHQNHIFRVRVDSSGLLPQYLEEYLQHPKAKKYFLGCAKQTTGIASINMTQLRNLPVLLPSLEQQKKFSDFTEQISHHKLTIQRSLDKMETLKKALMQEYFGG